jgi:hypothetical protein
MTTVTISTRQLLRLDAALTAAMQATGIDGTRNYRLYDDLLSARAYFRVAFDVPITAEVEQPKPASEMDFRSTLAAWEQAL